jgi:hypothetical protein
MPKLDGKKYSYNAAGEAAHKEALKKKRKKLGTSASFSSTQSDKKSNTSSKIKSVDKSGTTKDYMSEKSRGRLATTKEKSSHTDSKTGKTSSEKSGSITYAGRGIRYTVGKKKSGKRYGGIKLVRKKT